MSPPPDDEDRNTGSGDAPEDAVYVLKDGARLGPFTEDELLEMIEEGTLQYEDVCLRAGRIETERIHQVLDWEEDRDFEIGPAASSSSLPPEKEPTDLEEDWDEDDDEEEWEPAAEALSENEEEFSDSGSADEPIARPRRQPAAPPRNPNLILYAGHPSVLSFPKSLLLIAIGIGGGLYGRTHHPGWLLAGLVFALFGVSWVLLQRSMRLYLITPRRVEIVTGLIAKNSNEVRIEDIRTINVLTPGLRGLLGVGTVEFASAGGSSVEVAFAEVHAAHRIKGLVRRLQDAMNA